MANKDNKNKKNPKKTTTKKVSNKTKYSSPYSNTLYKKLVDDTSIIFLYDPTINLLKTNEKLRTSTLFFINAIYTYEIKNNIKDQKANDFKIAFESLTKQEIDLRLLSKSEIESIDDEINFLEIFIKNTLNEDWKKIVNSFKQNNDQIEQVTSISLGVDEKDVNNNYDQNQYQNNFNHHYQNFNAEEFMKRNNISLDQIADSAIQQQASLLLQNDIVSNKFYKYKTKPTFFIIFKWLLVIMWMLTAIVLIINSFSMVGLDSSVYLFLFKDIDFNAIDTSNMNISQFMNSVIGNNGFLVDNPNGVNIFGYILSLIIPFFIIYYAISQIRNYKNDNAKFTCKTFITWLLLIWIFFILFSSDISSLSTKLNVSNIIKATNLGLVKQVVIANNIDLLVDNKLVGTGLILQSISTILYFVFIGLSILLSSAIIITRPKIDAEKMQSKINEYVSKIKSGEIPFNNSSIGNGWSGLNPFNPF